MNPGPGSHGNNYAARLTAESRTTCRSYYLEFVSSSSMKYIYAGIRVRDLDRSLRFYVHVMGMKQQHKLRMPHGGVFAYLTSPGRIKCIPSVSPGRGLELNYYPEGSKFYEKYRSGSELDHIGFWVSDVDGIYEQLVGKGVKEAVAPFPAGKFRLAFLKDPDGNWIELIGYKSSRRRGHK
jgi:lactoylglutathione lyase